MTKNQEMRLPELLENFIMSSRMEGLEVSESIQAMCLSVLRGESTLDECLRRIRTGHA